MRVQLNTEDVNCILKVSVDSVYDALKDIDGEKNLFVERKIFGNKLAWDLDGEGWKSLADCDMATHAVILGELNNRKQTIYSNRPANERETLKRSMSVPNDSYIFFKTDEKTGVMYIKLTAWGYSLPVPPPEPPPIETIDIIVQIVYDGKPCANKDFFIILRNETKYSLCTNALGKYNFSYPKNETLRFEIDGREYTFDVIDENKIIDIDITQKTKIVVKVLTDSMPECGATVVAVNQEYLTDSEGKVEFEAALPQNDEDFSVSVKDQTQKQSLKYGTNFFQFEFFTPTPEPEIVSEPERDSEPKNDIGLELDPEPKQESEKEQESKTEQESNPEPETQEVETEVAEKKTGGNGAKVFFGIIGLLLLVAATYFACYQLLNQ